MALAYDFDIFEVIPGSGLSDPQLDEFLTDAGFRPQRELATVALFRDLPTAEALRKAPPGLRDYFLASGFGLNTYSSGAPRGCYPAKDETARLELIRRLAENAPRFALPRPEDCAEGGSLFRLGAFLAELDRAQPVAIAEYDCDVQNAVAGLIDAQARTLPPVFETDPFSDPQPVPDPAPAPRKFWQNRFFRIGAGAALVLGVMQLASGPALTVLASL